MSRSKSFILNYGLSIISQSFNLILRFVIRKLFIQQLGIELLGYTATFGNILGFLNLTEMGIGFAITYKMYKPLYEKDYTTINNLLLIYKNLYSKIRKIIFFVGLMIIPVLPLVLNKSYNSIGYIGLIFLLQLLTVIVGYIYSYRKVLLNVYEKNYYISFIEMIGLPLLFIGQLVSIVIFENYYLYALSEIMVILFMNYSIHKLCKNKFSFLNDDIIENQMEYENVVADVKTDIKNVMIVKLGGYVLNSTDFIIVSSFLGIISSAMLSNYYMIFMTFQNLILTAMNSVQSIVGNLSTISENKRDVEAFVIKLTVMLGIVATIFCPIAFRLSTSFLSLWIGKEYVLNSIIPFLLSINCIMAFIANPIGLLFGALGYFKYDKKIIVFSATVNISLSIILANKIGISGVLIGTLIATLIYWISRLIILYKNFFDFSITRYLVSVLLVFITIAGSYFLVNYIFSDTMVKSVFDFIVLGVKLVSGVLIYLLSIGAIGIFYMKASKSNR